MPQVAELAPVIGDAKGDDVRTRTQRAAVCVRFALDDRSSDLQIAPACASYGARQPPV